VTPRPLCLFRAPARLADGFGPKELPYLVPQDSPQEVGPPPSARVRGSSATIRLSMGSRSWDRRLEDTRLRLALSTIRSRSVPSPHFLWAGCGIMRRAQSIALVPVRPCRPRAPAAIHPLQELCFTTLPAYGRGGPDALSPEARGAEVPLYRSRAADEPTRSDVAQAQAGVPGECGHPGWSRRRGARRVNGMPDLWGGTRRKRKPQVWVW
jgi:hypothetical protein